MRYVPPTTAWVLVECLIEFQGAYGTTCMELREVIMKSILRKLLMSLFGEFCCIDSLSILMISLFPPYGIPLIPYLASHPRYRKECAAENGGAPEPQNTVVVLRHGIGNDWRFIPFEAKFPLCAVTMETFIEMEGQKYTRRYYTSF